MLLSSVNCQQWECLCAVGVSVCSGSVCVQWECLCGASTMYCFIKISNTLKFKSIIKKRPKSFAKLKEYKYEVVQLLLLLLLLF